MVAAVSLAGSTSAHAACTGALKLTVTKDLALGTFTRPTKSGAAAAITVAPDGTRTVPPNLTIASDTRNPARAPGAATAEIAGQPNCSFRITVDATTGDLSNVRLLPAAGYALSSTSSGATGSLDALGKFRFTVGASQLVGMANTIGGRITLRVTYN